MMIKLTNKINFEKYYKLSPSGIVLAGILSSIIPLTLNLSPVYIILTACFLSVVFLMFVSRMACLNYVIWICIGFAAFQLNSFLYEDGSENLLLKKGLYAQVKFSAFDNSLSGDKKLWLPQPKDVYITVYSYSYADSGKWQNLDCKMYMKNIKSEPIKFGNSYIGSGIIIPADKSMPGSYSNYLKSMGVKYLFYPENIKEISSEKTIWAHCAINIIHFRNWLLERCASGITQISIKDFLAGILFGFRQGLDNELKNKFLQTGTIHIIAISGTHIGILALLFMFLFKPLPVRSRYVLVPITLLIYIIAIGYLQSAVRAFLMVSIFMLLKAFLRVSNPYNILFFTCSIMLLFNPFSVLNPGFLFSYVIVFFLLLGWKVASELKSSCSEKEFWRAKEKHGYTILHKRKLNEWIVLGVASTLIAGFAGVPLQLIFNGLFTPVVPLVSLLVLPLMFPLFFFSFLKMIIVYWTPDIFGMDFLNLIICEIVKMIFSIVSWGNDLNLSFYIPRPPWFLIALFYLSLIAILIFFERKKLIYIASAALSAIILFFTFQPYFQNDNIIINTKKTNIIITSNYDLSAVVVNAPRGSVYHIQNILRNKGMNSISKFIVTESDSNTEGDALKLLELYRGKTNSVVFMEGLRKLKNIERIKAYCDTNHIKIELSENPDALNFYYEGNSINISRENKGELGIKINEKAVCEDKLIGIEEGKYSSISF
ncbi:MAG TPA: hypothetical protein DD381_06705 [Lentisphaeria bacterium]|nr:MAG: hypothetical protein A2X47_13080 [Lentisphaerae bacterium GWF2_38_69]HBM16014.1 hypothetical protein [Lentisphaeria bacterium]